MPAARQRRRVPTEPDENDPRRADKDADPYAVARSIVLRQLTMAARSRGQLAQALADRAVPAEVADAVLDRMEAVGLVDDQAFASGFVSYRHAEKGLSRSALAYQLRERGVAQDVIDEAVEQVDQDTERRTALRLAHSRARSLSRLEPSVQRRRLAGMLARKGYPAELVYSVVDEVVEEGCRSRP